MLFADRQPSSVSSELKHMLNFSSLPLVQLSVTGLKESKLQRACTTILLSISVRMTTRKINEIQMLVILQNLIIFLAINLPSFANCEEGRDLMVSTVV